MAELTDIRVELEAMKQELNNVNSIHTRLDTAIDKLTDVSTSIKSIDTPDPPNLSIGR